MRSGLIAAGVVLVAACSSDPVSTPLSTEPLTYQTVASVFEMPGRGPEIVHQILESYPPQGTGPPLSNWTWDLVDNEESIEGTTWTGSLRLVGTWDGEVFTLTEDPTPSTEYSDFGSHDILTEGCDIEDFQPIFDFLDTIDREALGIIGGSEDPWDGRCSATIEAYFDTPELREAIEPMADRITAYFFFSFTLMRSFISSRSSSRISRTSSGRSS